MCILARQLWNPPCRQVSSRYQRRSLLAVILDRSHSDIDIVARLPIPLPAMPRQSETTTIKMLLEAEFNTRTLHSIAALSVKAENIDRMVRDCTGDADGQLDHGSLDRLMRCREALRDDLILVERLTL